MASEVGLLNKDPSLDAALSVTKSTTIITMTLVTLVLQLRYNFNVQQICQHNVVDVCTIFSNVFYIPFTFTRASL